MNDSISPPSPAVTIPSATFCSTARARTSLSRSAALSAVIDATEPWSSADCTNRSTKVDTLARSSSARIGAKMKSTAPLAYAVAVSVSSRPYAVRKMIGVSSDWLRWRISAAVS